MVPPSDTARDTAGDTSDDTTRDTTRVDFPGPPDITVDLGKPENRNAISQKSANN